MGPVFGCSQQPPEGSLHLWETEAQTGRGTVLVGPHHLLALAPADPVGHFLLGCGYGGAALGALWLPAPHTP